MGLLVSADSQISRQLHNFGSSFADVKCYQRMARIIAEYSQPGDLMVVNADPKRLPVRQLGTADLGGLLIAFIRDLEWLAALFDGPIADAVYAEAARHGEILSAQLMAALLSQLDILDIEVRWLDARDFLCAERAASPR